MNEADLQHFLRLSNRPRHISSESQEKPERSYEISATRRRQRTNSAVRQLFGESFDHKV